MTRLLLYPLLIAGLALGAWCGYTYYTTQRLPALADLQSAAQLPGQVFSGKVSFGSAALPKIDQLNQPGLTQSVVEGKKRVDSVLSGAIEVASDSSKPAAQKALDYGRYLYCKQVVEEYEGRK